ncbi:hypothetical protein ACWEJ6_12355 [Nonomuraea sp. NPDC004702]
MPDTAAVALVPGAIGRAIRVAGDVLTMMEFPALERGTGRRLWLRRRGDADELAAGIRPPGSGGRDQAGAGEGPHPGEYVALQHP